MAERKTASGLPLPQSASGADVAPGLEERLGAPGEFPFTRGIRAGMYRERPWTIRQLAGFGTARDTNARYRVLLEKGSTGINGVFDYPSLRAFDSDHPQAQPDVGRGGVAVDVREDFLELFEKIPLDQVSVSLVSSQPIGAAPHLAMFLWAAEQGSFERAALAGTSQNDFLMETAVTIAPAALPPAGSFRVACDVFEFALGELPRWNPISIAGYNYREAGADAPLEMALVLAHARAVVHELSCRGHAPESFLRRITFFLNAHRDFFEEVAKFRAIRRMWAQWVRDEVGVKEPSAQRFRFHTQTSGVSNTARFAHVNIARSALQAFSAVVGGTQSLHVNGYDEALSIPTEHSALTALRTQYMLLHETGVADSADPLGGSWLVESLTDAIEARANEILAEIDDRGGIVAVTESGWVHQELERIALEEQRAIDSGQLKVVGLNTLLETETETEDGVPFDLPVGTLDVQRRRLEETRSRRDDGATRAALEQLGQATKSADENVMPHVIRAVADEATLGEIGDSLRSNLGSWQFPL